MIDLDTDIKTAIQCRNGELVVKRTQDVEPYLEANKREISGAPTWRPYAGKKKLRKLAEIPNIVVEQWLKEGINALSSDPEMQKKVRQKLDSNEWQHLRTYPGRMGVRRQWV